MALKITTILFTHTRIQGQGQHAEYTKYTVYVHICDIFQCSCSHISFTDKSRWKFHILWKLYMWDVSENLY